MLLGTSRHYLVPLFLIPVTVLIRIHTIHTVCRFHYNILLHLTCSHSFSLSSFSVFFFLFSSFLLNWISQSRFRGFCLYATHLCMDLTNQAGLAYPSSRGKERRKRIRTYRAKPSQHRLLQKLQR
ncbi:hypothetical protein V8F06_002985 [Rhypophila decipiens]